MNQLLPISIRYFTSKKQNRIYGETVFCAVFAMIASGCALQAPKLSEPAISATPASVTGSAGVPAVPSAAQPENLTTFSPSKDSVTKKTIESPTEIAVRERAQARWNHLLQTDMSKAYEFLSPNARKLQSIDAYKGSIRAGLWRTAEIVRVDCVEALRCVVTANVVIRVPVARLGPTDHSTFLREDWISSEGQWWFVPART